MPRAMSSIIDDPATIHHPRGSYILDLYRLASKSSDFVVDVENVVQEPNGAFIQYLSLRNKEKGVSLLAWIPVSRLGYHGESDEYASRAKIVVKVRVNGSAYRNALYSFLDKVGVEGAFQAALDALSQLPMPRGVLPDPRRFTQPSCHEEGAAVVANSNIAAVAVLRVVVVGPDMVVTDDISTPGADCWFLLDCVGHQGATFNIVSDGEVFYTTNRVTGSTKKIRASSSYNIGKKTVDLRYASEIDKLVVNRAIEVWLNKS